MYAHGLALLCMPDRFNSIQLIATLWTAACQAPLSIEFSRQKYWSGLPLLALCKKKRYIHKIRQEGLQCGQTQVTRKLSYFCATLLKGNSKM